MIVPKLRAPIVLVHGFLGFNHLKILGWSVASYFARIPDYLSEAGNRVLAPRISPTAGVADRAGQLREFLDREAPAEPVHLIAHSMGGLDARYLITHLGMADRVLSLTTLGTPHRGSPFADWGIQRVGDIARPILELFDIPYQSVYDLTTERCRSFNETTPDAPNVRYFSIAGRHEGGWLAPEWQISFPIVAKAEGPNDGVVSVLSATYGESLEIWQGDHVSLINWLNPISVARGLCHERRPYYAAILRRLADEGF